MVTRKRKHTTENELTPDELLMAPPVTVSKESTKKNLSIAVCEALHHLGGKRSISDIADYVTKHYPAYKSMSKLNNVLGGVLRREIFNKEPLMKNGKQIGYLWELKEEHKKELLPNGAPLLLVKRRARKRSSSKDAPYNDPSDSPKRPKRARASSIISSPASPMTYSSPLLASPSSSRISPSSSPVRHNDSNFTDHAPDSPAQVQLNLARSRLEQRKEKIRQQQVLRMKVLQLQEQQLHHHFSDPLSLSPVEDFSSSLESDQLFEIAQHNQLPPPSPLAIHHTKRRKSTAFLVHAHAIQNHKIQQHYQTLHKHARFSLNQSAVPPKRMETSQAHQVGEQSMPTPPSCAPHNGAASTSSTSAQSTLSSLSPQKLPSHPPSSLSASTLSPPYHTSSPLRPLTSYHCPVPTPPYFVQRT